MQMVETPQSKAEIVRLDKRVRSIVYCLQESYIRF